jgi:acetyl-CoA acetyltransferase
MTDAFIHDGVRTPFGRHAGALALTAVRQLERSGGRYALVTLCIGVGQGLAAMLERVS